MTVATLGQKTVLVIEDDPWTRTITTALLAGEGFAVVEAKNGEEGLQQARTHAPDAILLDLALPTKSGLDVLRELKADAATARHPGARRQRVRRADERALTHTIRLA